MSQRRKLLLTSVEKIAAGMSDTDVKVIFTTDGRIEVDSESHEITLPLPPEHVDDTIEDMMRNWVDHESAHLRFDSKNWDLKLFKDKVIQNLCELLEDCRVDRLNRVKFPGTGENRRRGFDIISPTLPCSNILQAALFVLYEILHDYSNTDDAIKQWTNRLGDPSAYNGLKSLISSIDKQIERLRAVKTQDQVIEISREIKEIWKNLFRNPDKPVSSGDKMSDGGLLNKPQKSSKPNKRNKEKKQEKGHERSNKTDQRDGKRSEETKKGESEDDNNGEEDSNRSNISEGHNKNIKETETDKSEDNDNDEGDSNQDDTSEDHNKNIEEQMQELLRSFKSISEVEKRELKKELDKLSTTAHDYNSCPPGYRPFCDNDAITNLAPKYSGLLVRRRRFSSGITQTPEEFRADIRSKLGLFQRKLIRCLMSKRRLWVRDKEDGAIDDTRLYRVPVGDKRVFKHKLSRPSLNIAISVLMDMSGSMHGYPMYLCAQLGYILAETCAIIGVPFESLGFTTYDGSVRHKVRNNLYYHRTNPLNFIIIKDFNSHNRSDMLHKFYAAAMWIGGGTIEGEAVWWAARRLSKRRERRKLLITICDGAPNGNPAPNWKFKEHVKDVVSRIRKAGIETVHVGIETDAPKNYVPPETFIQYDGVDSLITEFAPYFGEILRGDRRRNTDPIPI